MIANAAGIKSKRVRKGWSANDFLPASMKRDQSEPVMMGKITDLQIFLSDDARRELRERA